jgi:hypothetical protein
VDGCLKPAASPSIRPLAGYFGLIWLSWFVMRSVTEERRLASALPLLRQALALFAVELLDGL